MAFQIVVKLREATEGDIYSPQSWRGRRPFALGEREGLEPGCSGPPAEIVNSVLRENDVSRLKLADGPLLAGRVDPRREHDHGTDLDAADLRRHEGGHAHVHVFDRDVSDDDVDETVLLLLCACRCRDGHKCQRGCAERRDGLPPPRDS
jgi:hypothetical protein